MAVRMVLVMRFLFSAIMASMLLGGEAGVAVSWSETESPDGIWVCCNPRREVESRNGLGVGARF